MQGKKLRAATLMLLVLPVTATAAAAQQSVQLPGRDRVLGDRPAAVYSVGRAEGQSWEMFSGITSMAFDAADNLYLLDNQNTRVVVFDARGRFVREFGRRGGGPGEFQAPIHLAIDSQGNVVVSDLANRAFIVFTPAGEHVRNVPYHADLGMPTGGIMSHPRGGLVVRASSAFTQAEQAGNSFASLYRQGLTDGAAPSMLTRIPIPPPQVTQSGSAGQQQRMVIRRDPVFAPRLTLGVLPDGGLALHHETEYAVKIHDGNGRHVRTITRGIRPRRVTRQDQEAWRERQRNAPAGGGAQIMVAVTSDGGPPNTTVTAGGAGRGGAPPSAVTLGEPDFAEVMAVVTGVRTDPQGRIWIQRRHSDGSDRGPIDLVDAAGRYIGTIPAQALPNAVSASGLAAWVARDELGVERVTVRRLPQTWR